MIKDMAGEGLETTPEEDVTPPSRRTVSERSNSPSAAFHR